MVMRRSRSNPAFTWLRLSSVCANIAAVPTESSEKLTCPARSRLDHLRALGPPSELEAARDVMLCDKSTRVMRHAGKTLQASSASSSKSAPNPKNAEPDSRFRSMEEPLLEVHRSSNALAV